MICTPCSTAGAYNTLGKYGLAKASHDECKGDCGCLHKTGPGWFIKLGEKPKAVQTQSP